MPKNGKIGKSMIGKIVCLVLALTLAGVAGAEFTPTGIPRKRLSRRRG